MAGSPLVSVIKLFCGVGKTKDQFQKEFNCPERFWLIEVLDASGGFVAQAIVESKMRYRIDDDGAYAKVTYMGTSSPTFHKKLEREAKKQEAEDLPTLIAHFCRLPHKECIKNSDRGFSLHIQKFAPASDTAANALLRTWGYAGVPLPPPRPPGRVIGKMPPAEVEVPRTRKKLPMPKGTNPEAPRVGGVSQDMTALDAMIDAEPTHHGDKGEFTAKLDELKKKLQGATTSSSKKPKDDLTKRAVEAAGKLAKQKDKDFRKQLTSKAVAKTLEKVIRKRKRSSSEDVYEESVSEETDVSGHGSGQLATKDLNAKRQKYRKIAMKQPGKLMLSGLELMQDQMGKRYGESEETLSPIVLRYLQTMIIPALGANRIQESRLREMRTLATGLDELIRGNLYQAGDLMMQRLKSLIMQARDGSEQLGKFIELLPEDLLNAGSSLRSRSLLGPWLFEVRKVRLCWEAVGSRSRDSAGMWCWAIRILNATLSQQLKSQHRHGRKQSHLLEAPCEESSQANHMSASQTSLEGSYWKFRFRQTASHKQKAKVAQKDLLQPTPPWKERRGKRELSGKTECLPNFESRGLSH